MPTSVETSTAQSPSEDSPFDGSRAAVTLTVPGVVKVKPFRSDSAKVFRCYENVRSMIERCGGEAVFGWVLADCGPRSRDGHSIRSLYRRWVNHVVWSDARGTLWEVTPCFTANNPNAAVSITAEFLPDPFATFRILSDREWTTRPSRFVPVCPEGEEVARLLGQAQCAGCAEKRLSFLTSAVSTLQALGYDDPQWHVGRTLQRTGGIWLTVR